MALAFFFFLGISLSQQFFSFRQFFINLSSYRAQRQRDLFLKQAEFYQQALEFLLCLGPTMPKVQTLTKELKHCLYRPSQEFREDTRLWKEAMAKNDFDHCYAILEQSRRFLPKEYADLWLLRTMTKQLSIIAQEKELRLFMRNAPKHFFEEGRFSALLAQKISLFSSHKDAFEAMKLIKPELIDEQCRDNLLKWMMQKPQFWAQSLKGLWVREILSPQAESLLKKLI